VRLIPIDSVPLEDRPHVREGRFRSRRLLAGEPGTPGNFSLQLVTLPDRYLSPRHRHNFDQVRYQLDGDFDFAADGRMRPGSIAYFPEGTHYGPQSSTAASTTLVLQFGGASGSGYLSEEQYQQAAAELARTGSFAKGVYTRVDSARGKVNQDAYEAVWEYVNGRALTYPRQRYARPIFMEPESFDWLPCAAAPGVEERLLGVFSERGTRLAFLRAAPGAAITLDGNAIYYVERGSGFANGAAFAEQATIHCTAGESVGLRAETPVRILQLGLPFFG
jgi:hypothetical protein